MTRSTQNGSRFCSIHPSLFWCLFWLLELIFPGQEFLLSVEDVVIGYGFSPSLVGQRLGG